MSDLDENGDVEEVEYSDERYWESRDPVNESLPVFKPTPQDRGAQEGAAPSSQTVEQALQGNVRLRQFAADLCLTRSQIQLHPARDHDASVREIGACSICCTHAVWMWPRLCAAQEGAAKPVAQLLYDTMPDMISAILSENEIDPRLYAEKWAEAIGPLYAHPESPPEGPWKEGFAPPHETVLARDAKGDLYQARVCYGMHPPFWCGHSGMTFGKILENEGISITHWMRRDALNALPGDAPTKEES